MVQSITKTADKSLENLKFLKYLKNLRQMTKETSNSTQSTLSSSSNFNQAPTPSCISILDQSESENRFFSSEFDQTSTPLSATSRQELDTITLTNKLKNVKKMSDHSIKRLNKNSKKKLKFDSPQQNECDSDDEDIVLLESN